MPRARKSPFPFLRLPPLRQQDLVDEVDDGGGGLLGVQLREHVADVLRLAAGLLRYETKHPERKGEKEKDGETTTLYERKGRGGHISRVCSASVVPPSL